MNKRTLLKLLACAPAILIGSSQAAPIAIPPEFAMPAGSVDTSKPGFLVRPYQTTDTPSGQLSWVEDQLAGFHGPNIADLSGADANGYYTVPTVVNWNITEGGSVDNLAPADLFPGISDPNVNFSDEILTYIEFPAAGTYTLGVNSDDGFRVAAANLNPKDRFNAIVLGEYNSTRGSGDTLFDVSVSKAGIYPFRIIYFQGGGGANLSFFQVVTNPDQTTTDVLINDSATEGALKAYTTASVAPPYVTDFAHNPTGFAFNIRDDASALAASSLHVKLNGSDVPVTTSKNGKVTAVSYNAPSLIAPGVQTNVEITFSDDAAPSHASSAKFTFAESSYSAIPASAAVPADAVDTTKRGFIYRLNQIDAGPLGANIAHAEAQLAGVLTDADGNPYPNIATGGEQPDGSFVIADVINFSLGGTDLGSFTSANAHADAAFPGLPGDSGDNMAIEIVTYLDLKAGYYTFGVNSADGFRLTTASNPYDVFGTPLGIFDFRRIPAETQFGVVVQNAGIYPVRLVCFRQGNMADNSGNAELEFYIVNKDGSRVLINDPANANAVKAYWKRTGAFGPYVKYAGPTSFVSPFAGPDVGFKDVKVIISDGSTAKVDPATATLSVDNSAVTVTKTTANGLTTLTYTPPADKLQLPRTIHSGAVSYSETGGGAQHNANWSFNLLKNYVLPDPLFLEDFESTDAGPEPHVPAGWVEENHTGHQTAGFDQADLNSDFYLGWVVVDKSFDIGKDKGVSAVTPQVLNGAVFDEDANPLLTDHYIRAESDSRQNGPPGQIQYITTKPYDLTGKTGIVLSFHSAYEKNQDDIVGIEVSTDGGTTYSPVFYWLQDGTDSQGVPDILRDGLGKIDVAATMTTPYGDVAKYTDNGQLVGGYFGFFLKAPVTQALEPYIEGRVNDDGNESKRIELFRIPQADNQKDVRFRIFQAGTSSWYWAIDNWGIYSVPSIVGPSRPGPLTVARQADKIVITWPGTGTLQSVTDITGTWGDVQNATSPYSVTPGTAAGHQFFRLKQ